MINKGFRFGMLLQIAVGPICIFIFNEAVQKGMFNALGGVFGVVLIDAIFITLSIVGVATVVEKKEKVLKYFGSFILICFGIKTIVSAISMNEISVINTNSVSVSKTFLTSVFLTASNPLTIIFWSGVFSTKIIEEKMSKDDEVKFGIGAVFATLVFLSFIVVIGQFTKEFLNIKYIIVLNIIVGILLIYFGIRILVKKNK
jgi:threonine/homoserine/homoserine lactone efflux protein